MYQNEDLRRLFEIQNQKKQRQLNKVKNKLNQRYQSYQNYNDQLQQIQKDKFYDNYDKYKQRFQDLDNFQKLNYNMNVLNNIQKDSNKISNMLMQAPYFASQDLQINDNLRRFFAVYNKPIEQQKPQQACDCKSFKQRIKKNLQKNLDTVKMLIEEKQRVQDQKLEMMDKKIDDLKLFLMNYQPQNIYNNIKREQSPKYVIQQQPRIKKTTSIYQKSPESNIYKRQSKKKSTIITPKQSLTQQKIEEVEEPKDPTPITSVQSIQTNGELVLVVPPLDKINLRNQKENSKKSSEVTILTFDTQNNLIKKNKPNPEVQTRKKTKKNFKLSEKRKKQITKSLRKCFLVVIAAVRMQQQFKIQRQLQMDIYHENINSVLQHLRKYVQKQQSILIELWQDKENFVFFTEYEIKKLNVQFDLQFEKNTEDYQVKQQIAEYIKRIFENLILDQEILQKIKDKSKQLFCGKKKVFPENFFYPNEFPVLSLDQFGCVDLEDEKSSIFVFSNFYFAKIFLETLVSPQLTLKTLMQDQQYEKQVLRNNITFCTIIQQVYLRGLADNIKLKYQKSQSPINGYAYQNKKGMSILQKKYFKTSILKLPDTTQNLVSDVFFSDCLNYEIVEDFFEMGNYEETYKQQVTDYFECLKNVFNQFQQWNHLNFLLSFRVNQNKMILIIHQIYRFNLSQSQKKIEQTTFQVKVLKILQILQKFKI